MARVFITGSSQGLGFIAGKLLIEQKHDVVLHARNAARRDVVKAALPAANAVVLGDVSVLGETMKLADQVNALGSFDAVIHNVAIGDHEPRRVETVDGLSELFAVNVVAPYVLTALIHRPRRLIYLGSDMHEGGSASLDDPQWKRRPWNGSQAYSDSKLCDLILAMGVARRRPDTLVNGVDPGWVPTRMGGAGAPDDLLQGAATQAWLAVSEDPGAMVSGRYFHHRRPRSMNPAANRKEVQEQWFEYLRKITGVDLD